LGIGDSDVSVGVGVVWQREARVRSHDTIKCAERARMREGVVPFTFQLVFLLNTEETLRWTCALAATVFGRGGTPKGMLVRLMWSATVRADNKGARAIAPFD
jgi:hypothetical protein